MMINGSMCFDSSMQALICPMCTVSDSDDDNPCTKLRDMINRHWK